MKTYIDRLNRRTQEEQRAYEAAEARAAKADPRVVCDTPLTRQIEELMRSLPPAEQQRRWTMAEFVARLSGRYGVNPHPMHVGTALRALGWAQKRDWTAQGGGRRYWTSK